jgi:hypothetical protein
LVRVPLTLVAEAETVRVLHGSTEVAAPRRSDDADATVEAPAHRAGLVAAKRQAAGLPRRARLRQAVPAVATLFERLAGRGEALGPHVTRLAHLLAAYGAGSVAYFLEPRRRILRQLPPVPVVLPADPRVRDLDVTAHAREPYDVLSPAAAPPDAD